MRVNNDSGNILFLEKLVVNKFVEVRSRVVVTRQLHSLTRISLSEIAVLRQLHQ